MIFCISGWIFFYTTARVAKETLHHVSIRAESNPGLNLLSNSNLDYHDFFSDSWLLNKDTFLRLDTGRINIVEDACFVAIHEKGQINPTSRMFVDWTDFLVEHMSRWWVVLRTLDDPDPAMFRHTLAVFRTYLQTVAHREQQTTAKSPLHETIAIIAFSPFRSDYAPYEQEQKVRGRLLTAHSLAATISSLYTVGFGRIVVVGHAVGDKEHVDEAFRMLGAVFRKQQQRNHTTSSSQQIGDTELGYVRITEKSWVKTKDLDVNMPRGAIVGLQLALLGKFDEPHRDAEWLGTSLAASEWKYVYLTEPDTILHTKSWLLSSIQDGLDRGLSFFPHRLQPLPHESDLPHSRNDTQKKHVSKFNAGLFIPSHVHPFSKVESLNPSSGRDSCCDGGKSWVGRIDTSCGTNWWVCGFDDKIQQRELSSAEVLERHKRLVPYPLMRLEDGTGVVFGSSNYGRLCIPSKRHCQKGIGA